jgi:hypothetical protein
MHSQAGAVTCEKVPEFTMSKEIDYYPPQASAQLLYKVCSSRETETIKRIN